MDRAVQKVLLEDGSFHIAIGVLEYLMSCILSQDFLNTWLTEDKNRLPKIRSRAATYQHWLVVCIYVQTRRNTHTHTRTYIIIRPRPCCRQRQRDPPRRLCWKYILIFFAGYYATFGASPPLLTVHQVRRFCIAACNNNCFKK